MSILHATALEFWNSETVREKKGQENIATTRSPQQAVDTQRVHPYTGISLRHEEERSTDTRYTEDGP